LWTASGGYQNGFLVFLTFLAALGMLAGLILSTVAIVRQRERSLLVYLPLVVGVLALAFLTVEIVVGHD
jgi:ABC-type transport system involved in cytochrome c biogenesis permease subunit